MTLDGVFKRLSPFIKLWLDFPLTSTVSSTSLQIMKERNQTLDQSQLTHTDMSYFASWFLKNHENWIFPINFISLSFADDVVAQNTFILDQIHLILKAKCQSCSQACQKVRWITILPINFASRQCRHLTVEIGNVIFYCFLAVWVEL